MDGAWVTWRAGVFGEPYAFWHDGPEFTRLLSAAAVDLPGVARMLALGLTQADPLAAQAFAELAGAGSVPDGAVDTLRAAVPGASGTFLVRLAQAVYALTGDESCADLVVTVLRDHPNWYDRMDAAIALAEFPPTPAVASALAAASADPDDLVRGHAADTLRRHATGD